MDNDVKDFLPNSPIPKSGNIADAYPECRNAVLLLEDTIDNSYICQQCLKMFITRVNGGLKEFIEANKPVFIAILRDKPSPSTDPRKQALAQAGLPELDHPSVLVYLKGKAGMM